MTKFLAFKDPTPDQVERLFASSPSKTLRRIKDGASYWYWPSEHATHAEGAAKLNVAYHLPPGAGEIVVAG